MYKKFFLTIASILLITAPIHSLLSSPKNLEAYENTRVKAISIIIENLSHDAALSQEHKEQILAMLRTKIGDPFSQLTFDQDLKKLSEEYDRAIPVIQKTEGDIEITIQLRLKPMIRTISWYGNQKIKTRTLQKELGIQSQTIFNREDFNRAFTKVKEYYLKKGYFDSQLEYKLIPNASTNEVDVEIAVHEGNSGYIEKMIFNGLSKKEESDLLNLITTKKHNFFTSWIAGTGQYQEEALEHDQLMIVNYLQNKGYADAQAHIEVKETQEGRLTITIHANKGELYTFGKIFISGNHIFTEAQIQEMIVPKEGTTFSPEAIRKTLANIKELYGKDGYIETQVNYSLRLLQTSPTYDIDFKIDEGSQFKIGLIQVLGNASTNKNVILRESLLIPGEVFDLRKLKVTQSRLEAMGYFKSVNVYPVKTREGKHLGENYRDVTIEIEEATTGSVNFFFGFSTNDSVFGGLDLGENNFNRRGLTSFWKNLSNLRGAGEYAHARLHISKKQKSYTLSWMDPYFHDSLWRFGVDCNYSKTGIQADDYHVNAFGGTLFGSYPISSYWTYGWKTRLRNSNTHIHGVENEDAQRERQNSGWVLGVGSSLSFDSIDNTFKPHRGFRSIFECELAGVARHDKDKLPFPFFKVSYLNSYYYPIWRKGTLKLKWELRFACPFGQGEPNLLPLNERFFLGGETTVRGYKPYILGPHFKKSNGIEKDDPSGGVSSTLLSIEYNQAVFKMLDIFAFMDGGSISNKRFSIPDLRLSYGGGARIEIGNRLPMILGVGFPINPQKRLVGTEPNPDGSVKKIYKKNQDKKTFFISLGGQF